MMRINQFIANASGLSRRASDKAVVDGRVTVNGKAAAVGQQISTSDVVKLDGQSIDREERLVLILNKPTGYICSRKGQGGKTIYELLPPEYHNLKSIGRLDRNSSGLLLLTNDGQLAHELTHPSYHKVKVYEVALDMPLAPLHRQMISDYGVKLDDGTSKFELERQTDNDDTHWVVKMSEGRNRQIRRTFAALGYEVKTLHRTHFGSYNLGGLKPGSSVKIR